jgi:hypothetical protein
LPDDLATISHLGVANAVFPGNWFDPAAMAEFEEIFLTEVMTAFAETNVFRDLHYTRSITHGKSARFPASWKASSRYHQPGVPVLGSNQIKLGHRTINIDALLIADVFIDDLEEAMNYFEVRSIFSTEIGQALARTYDSYVARTIILAARAAATITGAFGGTQLSHEDAATDSARLLSLLWSANQAFDEKDVPSATRYGALAPAQYYMLVQDEKVQNTFLGGHGLMMQGRVPFVGDIAIVKSNHIPNTNIAVGTDGEQNTYIGDFTKTVCPVWHRSAAGTVSLRELTTQMTSPNGDFNVVYQGTLALGKMAVGHGILRPECAIEIKLP